MPRTLADPNRFAQDLFRPLPRRYDVLEELLSFGQNWRWRREMVAHVDNGDPSAILDVATGTAGVALALTRRTSAQITGIDITEAMLRRGQVRRRAPERQVAFARRRACRTASFPDSSFDALTFTYLLRYVADPAANAARARTCPQTRRYDRKPGVLGPSGTGSGGSVVAVHRGVLPVAGYLERRS